jgi:hypothetical protein
MGRALPILAVVALASCKVPIVDINAAFAVADATWFEEEETLFAFYRVDAEQGIGPESQIELAYNTDQVAVEWTPLQQITPVHTHVPVDCGARSMCGSISLHERLVPRNVRLQLRYHRDGAMTLPATVTYNVINTGPPQTNRSLLVYGVFDGTNNHVQWRARHQFPTLRNEQAQAFGLRRWFKVEAPLHGDVGEVFAGNPYGYGFGPACPGGMTALGYGPLETTDRAMFDPHELPLSTSTSPHLCAVATVSDAKGTFAAPAIAQKNPEVRPAFPALRSPIREDTKIGFLLRPCAKNISDQHLAMQKQRLLLTTEDPEICVDNWQDPSFADQLAAKFRARVDLVRAQGKDMVLAIALHHDVSGGQLNKVLESALGQVLPPESAKSSPRLSGAFVFDSYGYLVAQAGVHQLALWCPARNPDDLDLLTNAQQSCPLQPDMPELALGPFSIKNLPILPTRAQYLTFISKYSEAQAGHMTGLTFLAPERTPLSDNVPVGDFGVATFFNNEILTAAPTDAFSFCQTEDNPFAQIVVFRVPALAPDPIPLSMLPQVQQQFPQASYQLGLAWDFPYLLRLNYEVVLAGAITGFSVSVPFGIGSPSEAYYGTQVWQTGSFDIDKTLAQCTRYCDHPTFDSAGVYNVSSPFGATYANQCYRPVFPQPGDGGFPLDP